MDVSEPPPSAEEMVRVLAQQMITDHPQVDGGFCPTCRPLVLSPCDPRLLAESVLRLVESRAAG